MGDNPTSSSTDPPKKKTKVAKKTKPNCAASKTVTVTVDEQEVKVPFVLYNGNWMLKFGSKRMAANASIPAPTAWDGGKAALFWGDRWHAHLTRKAVTKKDGTPILKKNGRPTYKYVITAYANKSANLTPQQKKARNDRLAQGRATRVKKEGVSTASIMSDRTKAAEATIKANYKDPKKTLQLLLNLGYEEQGARAVITRYAKKNPGLGVVIEDKHGNRSILVAKND